MAIAVLLCGCEGGAGSGWAGVVRDSAGVVIVENPADGDWTLASAPELIEELRFGLIEGDPAYQFGAVNAIDVDGAGRIYVLDQQAAQVRVFDADGRHLRTVGRPGQGPGELSAGGMAVVAAADDVVFVADLGRQRIVGLGPDGREVRSVPMPLQAGVPVRWQPTGDGRFLLHTRTLSLPGLIDGGPQRDFLLLRDPLEEVIDTLFELRGGQSLQVSGNEVRIRLFEAEPVWARLEDGRIVHGRTDQYQLEMADEEGVTERVIRRTFVNRPVTETDRATILDLMISTLERQLPASAPPALLEQVMESIEFAPTFPVFGNILAGPRSTLWVQRMRTPSEAAQAGVPLDLQATDLGSPEWDVFDLEGRLLGPIRLPDRFTPLRVAGEHIYGVQRDDLDVQHVVRLRMVGADPS